MSINRSDDVRFHSRRAAIEHAAAESATCSAAREAHRQLSREHERAAHRAAREPSPFQLFDDAAFIRFARRVSSHGSPVSRLGVDAPAYASFKSAPHEGIGTLLRGHTLPRWTGLVGADAGASCATFISCGSPVCAGARLFQSPTEI